MNIIRDTLAIAALACLTMATITVAIDALELEQTGACNQCIVLQYIK